ncbi:hypothetical protein C8A05DRAFT_30070 [Staphylotrichum tortipilum]|uniref:Uncharacterized protein n=1 Tax=Staphylotrichum tortipilum TaxID=2831512 RepID=A0AAN6MSD7_9PEZI|nr:hypothetical protein C8A05DRAFT_30070 [Staphylotrichum longicolle]
MNRFRTKRRAKDDLAAGRASEDSEQSGLSFFRKGKKTQQEDVKKEFDLTTALPSNDDFRTSLLMNNLSARFSMLREQDDPNTKIGKASDDSVLFHKRQSRMADFGFGSGARGLSDIAEVESIRGATFLRTTSVASDDPDLGPGDSVLNRSRPTEGNNLFGGRQKIYKIPASSGGGMGGRAVYEDDVALSSFQRWRQTEREKALAGQTDTESAGLDEGVGHLRSGSPPPIGYNRKRETTSTTSSASIMARNSTAATSITSQGPITTKDGLSSSAVTTSSGAAPIPERNVTRTRRLYEQNAKDDSSEQQGSVLSRFEALSRPRPFGSRTPDLSGSTTPQMDSLTDRFGSRPVLAKASAPNLRSLSPPAANRGIGTLDLGIKVHTENKPSGNLGGLPPLSPPVSETGEQPILPILPKDVGKATAMGLFQKPSEPYNESQYVQRQLQLQQGRETPTRTEPSDRLVPATQEHVSKPAILGTRSSTEDARFPPTPVAEVEPAASTSVNLPGLTIPLDVNIERPSDKDHPAFRQSALPTPLSFGGKFSGEPLPRGKPAASANNSQQPSPEDSPTLGPASGLSGLVRQHLRTESVDSFGSPELDAQVPDFGFNLNSTVAPAASESRSRVTVWPSSESEWTPASPGRVSEPASPRREEEAPPTREIPPPQPALDPPSIPMEEDDTVEFASQIADARRRVREKLTSYVESDSSRAPSPLLLPTDSPSLAAPSSNPLGILKPKTSRGSLVDRSRNMITGQSKGLKLLGLGASTMSTPSQSGKPSFDEKEFPSLETMKEEVSREEAVQMYHTALEREIPGESSPAKDEDGGNAHPGLKAFRQARRELQRRKELETLARHQASQTAQGADEPVDQRNGMHSAVRVPRQRTPSRERRPPPVTYKQRPPSDEHSYSSPNGARPSGERSRSGSEASAGRSSSRPRTNTNTGPHDQLGLPNSGRPMMRSPGLPGTDIKGSPLMPPHPYTGRGGNSPAASPHLHQSRSAANLALHTGRPGLDSHSGQPSPISPMGLPSPAPYSMGSAASPVGTPTSFGPRPRLASASQSPALGPSNGPMPGQMKRPIDKRDISDPSFVMSTSRVPTTNLPHQYPPQSGHSQYPPAPHQAPPMAPGMGDGGRPYGGGPRSRSNSRAAGGAPPLPPINPRRRRDDSRTRAPREEGEMGAPRLPYAGQANNSDYGGASEDEGGNRPDYRRRLRKAHPDMQHPGPRPYPGGARDNSPPFVAKGPPASRSMASGMGGNTGMGMPGGMI